MIDGRQCIAAYLHYHPGYFGYLGQVRALSGVSSIASAVWFWLRLRFLSDVIQFLASKGLGGEGEVSVSKLIMGDVLIHEGYLFSPFSLLSVYLVLRIAFISLSVYPQQISISA